MPNEFDHYKNLEEVVKKFDNGIERFNTSAIFNQVCQVLARGGDQIKLIDQLINIAETSQQSLQDHLNHYRYAKINP